MLVKGLWVLESSDDRTTTDSGNSAAALRFGVKVGTGLALASFVLAVTFGAMARSEGWGVVAPIVCSLMVFSASAQFALATALTGGGGISAAVAAAALINGRFIPMGVAVAGDLRGSRVRKELEGQAVVDGSWAAAHLGGGRFDRYKLFGATVVQWPLAARRLAG